MGVTPEDSSKCLCCKDVCACTVMILHLVREMETVYKEGWEEKPNNEALLKWKGITSRRPFASGSGVTSGQRQVTKEIVDLNLLQIGLVIRGFSMQCPHPSPCECVRWRL